MLELLPSSALFPAPVIRVQAKKVVQYSKSNLTVVVTHTAHATPPCAAVSGGTRAAPQCARAVLQQRTKQAPGLKAWLEQLTSRTHNNVAAVALANKLARIAWAVLATGEAYRLPQLAAS